MISKNSMLTGFFVALVFPLIALWVSDLLKTSYFMITKPATPFFVAIVLNLILISICVKRDLDQTSRGIMLGTFIAMLTLFVIFKIRLH